MHELSLVSSIVETVTETLTTYPGARVKEVRLRVGVLASVIPESLEFCWGIVSEDTPLAGTRLTVQILPVIVHCEPCGQNATLDGVQSFRCPHCGQLCAEIRQGRELEIDSIEIDEAEESA
jgi:hydrogenase nickel incorporation protein HypA/HybF